MRTSSGKLTNRLESVVDDEPDISLALQARPARWPVHHGVCPILLYGLVQLFSLGRANIGWRLTERHRTFLTRRALTGPLVCVCPLFLAPVYGWFTEGFDTRDLKEAKALLEELELKTA